MGDERAPLNPKVTFGAIGAGVGVGMGEAVSRALAAFGLMTVEQAAALSPIFNFIFSIGGSFLGGYIKQG